MPGARALERRAGNLKCCICFENRINIVIFTTLQPDLFPQPSELFTMKNTLLLLLSLSATGAVVSIVKLI